MEEERSEAPTPTLGGETASATSRNPHHIPSLTTTKKRRPRDPEGAPAPNPRGDRGWRWGSLFNYHPRTASRSPDRARKGRGRWREMDCGDTHDLSGF